MKRLLPLFFATAFFVDVAVYAMENDFHPPSEAVCVNEILSGIQQKEPKQLRLPITFINEKGITERKQLLRQWRNLDKSLHAKGLAISLRSSVAIQYVDVHPIPKGIKMESRSKDITSGKCVYFVAELTPEKVVEIWSNHEVDEEKIPNKNWKQDLEEVKEILDLNQK